VSRDRRLGSAAAEDGGGTAEGRERLRGRYAGLRHVAGRGAAHAACPADAFASSSTPCDADADLCTTDECNGAGACVFVEPLDCEDGNVCTQDSCDPLQGCVSTG
jgi:Dictyostelium (slime mold) repeat